MKKQITIVSPFKTWRLDVEPGTTVADLKKHLFPYAFSFKTEGGCSVSGHEDLYFRLRDGELLYAVPWFVTGKLPERASR